MVPSATSALRSGRSAISRASARGTRVASALGKAPTRSSRAACADLLGELAGGELEPVRDHVGVLEQQRAGGRQGQPARPALEQPRAGLALQRGHLLGDGGLRE